MKFEAYAGLARYLTFEFRGLKSKWGIWFLLISITLQHPLQKAAICS
jgi:hypothetical protein